MSLDHNALKLVARKILESRGFIQSEIYEECPILTKGQTVKPLCYEAPEPYCYAAPELTVKRGIITDLIGVNKEQSLAIECGNTPPERILQLKLFFDQVIWIPVSLEERNKKLETENKFLKSRVETILEKVKTLSNM
jgi:hypothetical protein